MPEIIVLPEVNESGGTSASNSVDMQNYSTATITVCVSEVQGTNPTFDLALQHSPDDSNWDHMFKENIQGLFRRMSSTGRQTIQITKFARYVRASWNIEGTNPIFKIKITGVAN